MNKLKPGLAVFLFLSLPAFLTADDGSADGKPYCLSYIVSSLVSYQESENNMENAEVLEESETIILHAEEYQLTGEWVIQNRGPEFTQTIGLAMYTLDSDVAVTPGIEFWVNGVKVPQRVILNQSVRSNSGGIFRCPVNWAVIPVTFPENSSINIRFQYLNGYESEYFQSGPRVYLNEVDRDIGFPDFKGTPAFRVNIINESKSDSFYEDNWINNMRFFRQEKDFNKTTGMYGYLIDRDYSLLAEELFGIEKTSANSWSIECKESFTQNYERRLIIQMDMWDTPPYCFMESSGPQKGIRLSFLEKRKQTIQNYRQKSVDIQFNISRRKLSDNELLFLTNSQLRIMRNLFYAQYGCIFKDKELEAAFTSHYYISGQYKPNPDFSENMLTEIDRANIETIRKLENLAK